MNEIAILAIKGLVGGTMVVLFSLAGEAVRPRGLAGIFAAAPSVAIASLAVTVVATGVIAAFNESLGMLAGAAGMVIFCLLGTEAVKRFGALKGSIASTAAWFATALGLWALVLR
jgi:hypothetical protein